MNESRFRAIRLAGLLRDAIILRLCRLLLPSGFGIAVGEGFPNLRVIRLNLIEKLVLLDADIDVLID